VTESTGTALPKELVPARRTTLVIDVGGTGLKAAVLDRDGVMLTDRVRIPTTYPCGPTQLMTQLERLVAPLPGFDRLSVGFPGVVRLGIILSAPHFVTVGGADTPTDEKLVAAWDHFDLGAALTRRFTCPVRIINDADLQGLAAVSGTGVEVVITLGTGLGFSVFENGHLGPHLEFGQHRYRRSKNFDERVGDAARKKIGNRRWNKRMRRIIASIDALVFFDHLYIGGGNARHLTNELGPRVTVIDQNAAMLGGLKLWEMAP
jgi:polyphosphate glucokinase